MAKLNKAEKQKMLVLLDELQTSETLTGVYFEKPEKEDRYNLHLNKALDAKIAIRRLLDL